MGKILGRSLKTYEGAVDTSYVFFINLPGFPLNKFLNKKSTAIYNPIRHCPDCGTPIWEKGGECPNCN